MTKKYDELTKNELLELHNRLNKDAPLKSWSKAKSILIERIVKLEKLAKKKEAEKAKAKDARRKERQQRSAERKARERTIRDAALEHLCAVVYHENKDEKYGPENVVEASHPKAQSVGHTYTAIIDLIKEEFPDAETTAACLRWYSVKVRVEEEGYEGYKLPQRRPRSKSK